MTQNATVEMRNSSELDIQKLQPLLLRLVRTAPSETQAETEALKKSHWRLETLIMHKRSVKQANRSKL